MSPRVHLPTIREWHHGQLARQQLGQPQGSSNVGVAIAPTRSRDGTSHSRGQRTMTVPSLTHLWQTGSAPSCPWLKFSNHTSLTSVCFVRGVETS